MIICASFIPSGPGPSLFFLPAPLVLVSPRVVRSCTCHEKRCRAEREKDCMDSKSASPSCNQREKDQPGRRRGNGCLRLPLAYYEANINSFLPRPTPYLGSLLSPSPLCSGQLAIDVVSRLASSLAASANPSKRSSFQPAPPYHNHLTPHRIKLSWFDRASAGRLQSPLRPPVRLIVASRRGQNWRPPSI